MPLTAVFFDVGETLVDETELIGGWADWLGVPRLTFFATMGAVLARFADHPPVKGDRPVLREVLRLISPDLDVRDLRGNVDTRLRKVESGEYDAVMLAKAGLDRLGWSNRISEID